MDDMIVKNVDVMGDFITAAKDHDGNVWVGVRWVCDALDMTEGQMKRQIKNIKKDMVFGEGGSNQIPLPTGQGIQDVFCIRNDFIPLWLAKINITEKTREERPEFAKKLLKYQLKAKDILAAAFLPKQDGAGDVQGQIKLLAQGTTELYSRVESVESRITDLEGTMTLDYGQQQILGKVVNKTVISALGGKDSNAYNQISRKVFAECNSDLKDYFKVNARGNISKKRYEEAIAYAENWKPRTNTTMLIEQYNAQQRLDV